MRLWHRVLIPYLPRQQLIAQWRECCLIAKAIAEDGTPNHLLVNKITHYPPSEFNSYTQLVIDEMNRRGYRINPDHFWKWREWKGQFMDTLIFRCWHTDRYLQQCYYNLEEKYDCGGISDEEWERLCDGISEYV